MGFKLIELKRIDAQGRVVLPPAWRKKIQSNEVFLVEDGDLLLVIPKDNSDLKKYFNFLKTEVPPEVDSDYHQLKNYLLRGNKNMNSRFIDAPAFLYAVLEPVFYKMLLY